MKLTRKSPVLVTFIFGCMGALVNLWPVPLIFGVDFVFGGVLALAPAMLYGPAYGFAAGLLASFPTLYLWGHPYAAAIFAVEGLAVGWLVRRRRFSVLGAEFLFWASVGVPLVWVFYRLRLDMPTLTAALIMVKQPFNAVVNAAVCTLWVRISGLERILDPDAPRARPMRSLLAQVMIITAITPVIIGTAYSGRWLFSQIHLDARKHASAMGSETQRQLEHWATVRFTALNALAGAAEHAMENDKLLQQWTEFFHSAFPTLHNVYVANAQATTVAFHPLVNARGDSTVGLNFADRAYFEKARSAAGPFMTEVFVGRGGTTEVISTMVAPIRNGKGEFLGFVLGAIDLDQLPEVILSGSYPNGSAVVLVDSTGHIAYSSSDRWKPLDRWNLEELGEPDALDDGIVRLLPVEGSTLQRWEQGFYVWRTEEPVTGWAVVALVPVAPYANQVFWGYSFLLLLALVLTAGGVVVAGWVSRFMSESFERLASAARTALERPGSASWPISEHVAEVNELSQSLASVVSQLQETVRDYSASEHNLRQYSERLQLALHRTQIILWERDLSTGTMVWEGDTQHVFGVPPDALTSLTQVVERIHPFDRARVIQAIRSTDTSGTFPEVQFRCILPDGSVHWLDARGRILQGSETEAARAVGTLVEVTGRKRNEGLLEGQQRVLEFLAKGGSLRNILDRISGFVEDQTDEATCAIRVLEAESGTLRYATEPKLPPDLIAEPHSSAGEDEHPSLWAFLRREPLIIPDLTVETRWARHLQSLLNHGLNACWYIPVFTAQWQVAGAVELYFRAVRRPAPHEWKLMGVAAHLTGIALDRHLLERERSQLLDRRDQWVGQVVKAQEAERQRVARDLHDWLALGLVGPSYRIEAARQLYDRDPKRTEQELALVLTDLRLAGDELRKIMGNLRPYLLDELGLVEAIESYVAGLAQRGDISFRLELDRSPSVDESPLVPIVLFRVLQEALNNVVKHARASKVVIRLTSELRRVWLEVEDNGAGFVPAASQEVPGHYGIMGMTERVNLVGGRLEIASGQGVGTLVRVEIPILEE